MHDQDLLDRQIAHWRIYLQRRQTIQSVDIAELEDHLREEVVALTESGLQTDEAFLVAVKRMGNLDALSHEFAQEHSERLWKQLVVPSNEPDAPRRRVPIDAMVIFGLAVAAALMVQAPSLFGLPSSRDGGFYARNASLFVLPLLTGYFAWKRQLPRRTLIWLGLGFVAAATFANVYPFDPGGSTEILTAVHLPIAVWLIVGVAYSGDRWRQASGRMDFIRFSGEFAIYYVLIAVGGGILTAIMAMIFMAMIFGGFGVDMDSFLQTWWLPSGAAGAVLVAAWLVEAKQSVIENMAPVLTRIFTPLFAAVLVTFLGTLLVIGGSIGADREVLAVFDLLLVLVLGLLLYSASARDRQAPAGAFDVLQVVLLVSALIADVAALSAIAARITDYGLSANRVAVLGANLILLVNLAWSAVLYVHFLRGRGPFSRLEKWQTDYLPVYGIWAAIVVIVLPPIFRFA